MELLFNNQHVSEDDFVVRLAELKQQSIIAPLATEALRIDRLNRVIDLLKTHQHELVSAYSDDFGYRCPTETRLSDIMASIEALRYARDHLQQWIQPELRETPFPDTKALIDYRPKGQIGIISPWNFPIVLALGPLAGVLAAGNSAVLKPSELTPRGGALLCQLFERYFKADEISTLQGDATAGALFTEQPFDHLIFTGSTHVGKQVMQAAAKNLVPVTLELGGKSPVLLSNSADIQVSAERIMTVKTYNAGQICIAPDYVMLPEGKLDEFIQYASQFVESSYPQLQENPDYTAIINDHHYRRLLNALDDAKQRHLEVIALDPTSDAIAHHPERKLPPMLVINPPLDCTLMQEEIFGPVLPVLTYQQFDHALLQIIRSPQPLAFYYFGDEQSEIRQIRDQSQSGALVINDVMSHVLLESLPFGGIGSSGMGAYHGKEGFLEFSHARSVFFQSKQGDSNVLMKAPYTQQTQEFIDNQMNNI